MKKLAVILALLCIPMFAYAQEGVKENTDNNAVAAPAAEPSPTPTQAPQESSVKIGGNIETYGAAGFKSGDIYRGFVKLDGEIKYANDVCEIYGLVRAEKDTARPGNDYYYYKGKKVYKKDQKDGNNDGGVIPGNADIQSVSKRSDSDERIYLREAYINKDFYFDSGISSINLKLGKIIYTWGNADELKPCDIINPQDLSYVLLKPIQDRKYGVLSANSTIFINDNFNIEGILIPFFEPSDSSSNSFVTNDVKAIKNKPSTYQVSPYVEPASKVRNMNYAARFGYSVFKVDGHINYYNGYDHLPVMKTSIASVNQQTGAVTYLITPEYMREQMIGFDFQRALFSGISVRGEAAYFTSGKYFSLSSENKTANDPRTSPLAIDLAKKGDGVVEHDMTEYTLGVDQTDLFGVTDLYGNFQWNQKIIIGDVGDLKKERTTNFIMATIEYSIMHQTIKTKFRNIIDVSKDKGLASNIEVMYKLGANYDIGAGLWILSGNKNSEIGQFNDKKNVYITAKAVF